MAHVEIWKEFSLSLGPTCTIQAYWYLKAYLQSIFIHGRTPFIFIRVACKSIIGHKSGLVNFFRYALKALREDNF